MNEPDDRLAGDPVWELFPQAVHRPEQTGHWFFCYGVWLFAVGPIALGLLWYPPLAVVMVCLAFAARDFWAGWHVSRAISDKVGGKVCARFAYAWGAWKIGAAAFASMFPIVAFLVRPGEQSEPPVALTVAAVLWLSGFIASSLLAAWGLLAAYRSGMRIWIGEGVNRARSLFLMMLIVGFAFVVLGPWCFWLTVRMPSGHHSPSLSEGLMFFGVMFAGPVVILLILDAIQRRVIAEAPGKFGPKTPTVGKWGG